MIDEEAASKAACEAAYICADMIPHSFALRATDFEPIIKQAIRNYEDAKSRSPHRHDFGGRDGGPCVICGKNWGQLKAEGLL